MSHNDEIKSTLSFEEKLVKLLEHWLKHNEDHSETYMDWARKAKDKDLSQAASLIEDAADMTLKINAKFQKAVESIKTADLSQLVEK